MCEILHLKSYSTIMAKKLLHNRYKTSFSPDECEVNKNGPFYSFEMEVKGIFDVPLEVLEHICSFLSDLDISKLELTNKQLRSRILKTRIWRISAEKQNTQCKFKLPHQMLGYMRDNTITDRRYYKIVLGGY